jgi:hypothetical protein
LMRHMVGTCRVWRAGGGIQTRVMRRYSSVSSTEPLEDQ